MRTHLTNTEIHALRTIGNAKEVSERLGASESTVYKWMERISKPSDPMRKKIMALIEELQDG